MRRLVSFTAVALALLPACSGEDIDDHLSGRWQRSSGNEEMFPGDAFEFFPDGRFLEEEQGETFEGSYTTRDGILTLEYDEPSAIGYEIRPVRAEMPYWSDGDALQVMFSSPEHGGDDVADTWRVATAQSYLDADGSMTSDVIERVTKLGADGTASTEVFRDETSTGIARGTYTLSDGAIHFIWSDEDGDAVQSRDLRDRRLGGSGYVRVE